MWDLLIYNPIFNALIWLYNVIPGNDIGLAIIGLTIVIKLLLYPLTHSSLKSQQALQAIQPKVKAIQKEYKDNKEEQAKKLMELYKAEKVSPFSSCLPMLVQLPFLIAVYQVFREGLLSHGFDRLYSFVANPGIIDPIAFGFIDMGKMSVGLAIAAGAAQFVQAKMMQTRQPAKVDGQEIEGSQDEKMLAMMNKQMLYVMPGLTVIIGLTLPAGLSLYWFISTLFMVGQQGVLFYMKKKKDEPSLDQVAQA